MRTTTIRPVRAGLLPAALCAAALLPGPARGFEPQKHVEFSLDAVSLYKACTGRFVPGRVAQALADGAAAEDAARLSRAKDWHFWGDGGRIGRYWCILWKCNGSNDVIFAKRTRQLTEAIPGERCDRRLWEAAGRVAHHVQDMSSPAHVAPIFHYSGDTLDKYVPARLSNVAAGDLCAELLAPGAPAGASLHEEARALLDGAAKETRKAAAGPVQFADGGPSDGETWGRFWGGGADERHRGFVTYGPFGNTFDPAAGAGDPRRARYDRETLDRFFDARRRRAVLDTAKVIVLVEARRAGAAAGAGGGR